MKPGNLWRVIGSLVTALHRFKFHQKSTKHTPWRLQLQRKKRTLLGVWWQSCLVFSILSHIRADFLVFVQDFNNPSAQELLMARQGDSPLTGLRAAASCVCVLVSVHVDCPCVNFTDVIVNFIWAVFYTKEVKEINQVLHLLLWFNYSDRQQCKSTARSLKCTSLHSDKRQKP